MRLTERQPGDFSETLHWGRCLLKKYYFFHSASFCGESIFVIFIIQIQIQIQIQIKWVENLPDHSRSQRRTREHTRLPSRLMIDDDGERVGRKQTLAKFEVADPRGCWGGNHSDTGRWVSVWRNRSTRVADGMRAINHLPSLLQGTLGREP